MNYSNDSSVIFPSLTSLERQIALSPEQILAEQHSIIEDSSCIYQPPMEYFSQCLPPVQHFETIDSNNNDNSSCSALFGKRRSVDDLLSWIFTRRLYIYLYYIKLKNKEQMNLPLSYKIIVEKRDEKNIKALQISFNFED